MNRSGFSVPISCTCEDDTVTFGCSVDLFDGNLDTCSENCTDPSTGVASPCLVGSTCRNPLRYLDLPDLEATAFFQPCQAKAFTWAQDNANSQNSKCTSNYVSCCIGTVADGCPSTLNV